MKIDVMHALYTVAMILLSFVAALVITKTLSKYMKQKEEESEK